MSVYAVSGLTAGLAGVLVLGMNGQGYVGIGDPYLLASIAAVVLGGTSILGGSGTYAGTIPGAILLVTITALITVVNASAGWRSILFGSLILAFSSFPAASQSADERLIGRFARRCRGRGRPAPRERSPR